MPKRALWALLGLCSACGSISIRSNPSGADVVLQVTGEDTARPLGKTPLDIELSDLHRERNRGTVSLILKKDGFVPQAVVVPNLGFAQIQMDVNLFANITSDYEEVNRIISLVLRAERHLMENRLAQASQIAQQIRAINENIASSYHIDGTVYFLQRNFRDSRAAWLRAIELQPNNPEARAMLKTVEQRLGITSSPGSQ